MSQKNSGNKTGGGDGADLVQIGRVIKPHGVRGEVVVDATTDDPAGRFAVGTPLVGKQSGRERDLTVKSMRPHQGRLLVFFEEVPDRNDAETLRGMRFFAPPVFDDADDAQDDADDPQDDADDQQDDADDQQDDAQDDADDQ